LRNGPIILVIVFIASFFYLGINHFVVPKTFLFQETKEVKGKVTNVKNIIGIRGYQYELATYQYVIFDSVYVDSLKAGQREGHQEIGDRLLIEYAVSNPAKNRVIGYYRDSEKRNKKPVMTSNKK
jgi:hypothetical protein